MNTFLENTGSRFGNPESRTGGCPPPESGGGRGALSGIHPKILVPENTGSRKYWFPDEHRIPNPKPRIPNTEYRIHSLEVAEPKGGGASEIFSRRSIRYSLMSKRSSDFLLYKRSEQMPTARTRRRPRRALRNQNILLFIFFILLYY